MDDIIEEVYELCASMMGLGYLTDEQKKTALDAWLMAKSANLSWKDIAEEILDNRRSLWRELADM